MKRSKTPPTAVDLYTPHQRTILQALQATFGSNYYDTYYSEQGSFTTLGYCYKIEHSTKIYDFTVTLCYSEKERDLFQADIRDNAEIEDPSLQYMQISLHELTDTIQGLSDFWIEFLESKGQLEKPTPRWRGLRPEEVSFNSFNFTSEVHNELRFDQRGYDDTVKLCQAFLNQEIEAHELAFALDDIQKRIKS